MEKESKKVIALMSGTSCDSIDAGLCEVYPDMSVKLIKGINHPYPEHIRAKIFSAFRSDISIKELCQLNFAVGKCFADAAKILIGEFGKPDFIASHGQTVYHYPFDEKLKALLKGEDKKPEKKEEKPKSEKIPRMGIIEIREGKNHDKQRGK